MLKRTEFDYKDIKDFELSNVVNAIRNASSIIIDDRIDAILRSNIPYSRSNKDGHFTASGLVVADSKVLLIFHPYIGRWFQPGGHIDDGESAHDAAIREVYEETGLLCRMCSDRQDPLDVDIHLIPPNFEKGEGAHLHIDLLFELKVIRQEKSNEGLLCKWFSFEDVENSRLKRVLSKLSP